MSQHEVRSVSSATVTEDAKPPIRSIRELNEAYRELFHLEDDCVLPLLAAVVLNAKTPLRHVWMYLIGPSSGGKTTLLSVFNRVNYVEYVSDFTENTLLSGAQSTAHETSLLKRLGTNFVVIMKDFTTILSKPTEAQDRLMGQLREVYDGYLRKETGLGKTIEWGSKEKPNRSVFIMASTEAIYKIQERFSEMGSRGLNYVLKDSDRMQMTKTALKRWKGFDAKMNEMQERVKEYIAHEAMNLPVDFPDLDDEDEAIIAATAEFVTRARSVVLRDYRGEKSLALSAEMPTRVATQLQAVMQVLIHLNGGVNEDWIRATVMKCAMDCVPKQSVLVLRYLAEYPRVTTAGVASMINYPKERCKEWLENLQMHEVIEGAEINGKWYWWLRNDYQGMLSKYMNITRQSGDLEGEEDKWAESMSRMGNQEI